MKNKNLNYKNIKYNLYRIDTTWPKYNQFLNIGFNRLDDSYNSRYVE